MYPKSAMCRQREKRTIRSAVEQHLLDVNSSGGQSSEDSESGTSPASFSTSTKQRRRQSEEQDEVRRGSDVGLINKENIPSGFNNLDECILNAHHEAEKLHENTSGYIGERGKPKRQKSSCKLSELSEHQDSLVVSAYCRKIFTCGQLGTITPLFLAL
eukprot:bmy_21463T0